MLEELKTQIESELNDSEIEMYQMRDNDRGRELMYNDVDMLEMTIRTLTHVLSLVNEAEVKCNEHGDCKKCKHEFTSATSKPCKNCMWLLLDHFERKEE